VEAVLGRLQERELVAQLPRRPGQKEERYAQLLGGDGDLEAAQPPSAPPPAQDDRLEELEARVARLEDELASLRAALDGLRGR
jgi:uncharacterized protein YceH (UPF0502 family)